MNLSSFDSKKLGYLILRVVLGINMFMHGAVRLFGDYSGFANGVIEEFSGTILPELLVGLVAWGIPPVEFLVGTGLILGLFTKFSLLLGGALMATLVFGTCLLKNWGGAGNQMVYTLLFALLMFGLDYNDLSLDEVLD